VLSLLGLPGFFLEDVQTKTQCHALLNLCLLLVIGIWLSRPVVNLCRIIKLLSYKNNTLPKGLWLGRWVFLFTDTHRPHIPFPYVRLPPESPMQTTEALREHLLAWGGHLLLNIHMLVVINPPP
jgi:hypothetical protein